MGDTKKVWAAGRFGSRYGVGIRKRLLKIERAQRRRHPCPRCQALRVQRRAAGIFACKKCGHTFAGGAWTPTTMAGRNVAKTVASRAAPARPAGPRPAPGEAREEEKA